MQTTLVTFHFLLSGIHNYNGDHLKEAVSFLKQNILEIPGTNFIKLLGCNRL